MKAAGFPKGDLTDRRRCSKKRCYLFPLPSPTLDLDLGFVFHFWLSNFCLGIEEFLLSSLRHYLFSEQTYRENVAQRPESCSDVHLAVPHRSGHIQKYRFTILDHCSIVAMTKRLVNGERLEVFPKQASYLPSIYVPHRPILAMSFD